MQQMTSKNPKNFNQPQILTNWAPHDTPKVDPSNYNLGNCNRDAPVVDANGKVLLAALHKEVAEDDVEPLSVADALATPEVTRDCQN